MLELSNHNGFGAASAIIHEQYRLIHCALCLCLGAIMLFYAFSIYENSLVSYGLWWESMLHEHNNRIRRNSTGPKGPTTVQVAAEEQLLAQLESMSDPHKYYQLCQASSAVSLQEQRIAEVD
jgi:hypothetical protein